MLRRLLHAPRLDLVAAFASNGSAIGRPGRVVCRLRRHGSCQDFVLVFVLRDHVPARFPGGSLSKLCFSVVPALVSTAMNVVNSSYVSTDVVGVKLFSELGITGIWGLVGFCCWLFGCMGAHKGSPLRVVVRVRTGVSAPPLSFGHFPRGAGETRPRVRPRAYPCVLVSVSWAPRPLSLGERGRGSGVSWVASCR